MKRFAKVVALALAATGISSAEATQVLHRTPQQLAGQATVVVQGKVAGVRSYWNDAHTKIFTETQVSVQNSFKGGAPGFVRIVQLGGVVDNVRVTVHGALSWREGEEVLLFLEPYVQGAYQVSGFSQGKYNIVRDAKTGDPYVERPGLDGIELVGPAGGTGIAATPVEAMPLDRFIDEAFGGKGGAR